MPHDERAAQRRQREAHADALDDAIGWIRDIEYIHADQMSLCLLTLKSGYKIIGQAACDRSYSPGDRIDDSDREIGEDLAYNDAIEQLMQLAVFYRYQQRQDELEAIAKFDQEVDDDEKESDSNW